jgi:hypothetical protein
MWTDDERERVVSGRISSDNQLAFFKELALRCAEFCWYVKTLREYEKDNSKLPKKPKPQRVLLQMQGMSNNLGNFNLDPYELKWNEGATMDSEITLREKMELLKNRLSDLCMQRDNREQLQGSAGRGRGRR